jgi:hypothetical protein
MSDIRAREFPALEVWRRVARQRQPGSLIKLMIRPPRNENDEGDFIWTTDPLRTAVLYELRAREWYDMAKRAGNPHTATVCLDACDEDLADAIDILAAAEARDDAA